MKKPIFAAFAALLAAGLISCTQNVKESPTSEITAPHEHVLDRVDTLTAMFNAFCRQESSGDVLAVSPCGRYVGCLQISEIMVREANRVLGDSIYSYDDRYDAGCSYGIFKAVMEHHNPTLNIDKAVDIWNRKAPKSYRENVKKYYATILETW